MVFLQEEFYLLQAQTHASFDGSERYLLLLCYLGMRIAIEVVQFDGEALLRRELRQRIADYC